MKQRLCDINAAALDKLPQHTDDRSGIGVHYVDAYIKPMNAKLDDGTAVKCKRRGLKIVLTVGAAKGEGLMRRLQVSGDPVVMLDAALQEAARDAGVELTVEGATMYLKFLQFSPLHSP
jgi:hypothetical protein